MHCVELIAILHEPCCVNRILVILKATDPHPSELDDWEPAGCLHDDDEFASDVDVEMDDRFSHNLRDASCLLRVVDAFCARKHAGDEQ